MDFHKKWKDGFPDLVLCVTNKFTKLTEEFVTAISEIEKQRKAAAQEYNDYVLVKKKTVNLS